MQSLNNKGLSSVIQVTILSALTIISLAMVWGYVKDVSTSLQNQLSPAVDCITQESSILNACINSEGKIKLDINIGLDEKISNLNMNIDGEQFSCGISCQSCSISNKEGRQTIYLSPQGQNPQSLIASINYCNPQQVPITIC